MTLDVSVDDTQVVHVLEHDRDVSGNLHSLSGVNLELLLLHVQQVVQGALTVLEYDVDIRNLGDHAH